MFVLADFLQDLMVNEEKKSIAEKYLNLFGDGRDGVEKQPWFTDYLAKFESLKYRRPEGMDRDYDWDLLLRLVLGSFSSSYELKPVVKTDGGGDEQQVEYDLIIAVKSGDTSVVKTASELLAFQIAKLYDIYVEEQINLQIMLTEGTEEEKVAISSEREIRLKRRNAILETMNKDAEESAAKAEKDEKLGDLYGQL